MGETKRKGRMKGEYGDSELGNSKWRRRGRSKERK
jgi:hypothetical protein